MTKTKKIYGMDEYTVKESVVPSLASTTVRQLWLLIGGWLTGKGYLDESTATMIGGVIVIAAPIVWGQIRTWQLHKERVEVYEAAPNAKVVK